MRAKVQYSPDQRDAAPCPTPGMLAAFHPENVLAELLASWRAGACAAGRRLISEIDDLASHIRELRAEIAPPGVDQHEAE